MEKSFLDLVEEKALERGLVVKSVVLILERRNGYSRAEVICNGMAADGIDESVALETVLQKLVDLKSAAC